MYFRCVASSCIPGVYPRGMAESYSCVGWPRHVATLLLVSQKTLELRLEAPSHAGVVYPMRLQCLYRYNAIMMLRKFLFGSVELGQFLHQGQSLFLLR